MQTITTPPETIKDIAELLDGGMNVYLNLDTNEVVEVFGSGWDTYGDPAYEKELQPVYDKIDSWPKKYCFEPLESFESFRTMERFIDTLPEDAPITNELIRAISQRHPFAHFKDALRGTPERDLWFAFRLAYLEDHVRTLLTIHFHGHCEG